MTVRRETALLPDAGLLWAMVEAAPCAMVLVSRDGSIVLSNAQAEKLFGYTSAELNQASIERLVPAAARDRHPEHIAAFFAEPATRPMGAGRDLYGLTKDGREVPVEIGLSPVHTPDGTYVFASVVDITQRKRAEAALNELVKALESSNKHLEQYAAVAAHDLGAPLRSIIGFSKLLSEKCSDRDGGANTKEFLDLIMASARHLEHVVSDLLAMSRIHQSARAICAVNCETVIEGVLLTLQADCHACNGQVTHDPLPVVLGIRTQLALLLQNLISNGLKFHREGHPHVHVSAQRDGNVWKLSVRDDGIGISPENHHRILELFTRLNPEAEFEGSGIGLATCERIVRAHGGRIWVESELGKGATFFFTLNAEDSVRGDAPTRPAGRGPSVGVPEV